MARPRRTHNFAVESRTDIPTDEGIILATIRALRSISERRLFRTERGYHGRFYCALQAELEEQGLFETGAILEMEYQKSTRHGIAQRPDIILHIPAEDRSTSVDEGNFAVYALKRKASLNVARDDFEKLDTMFENLHYPLGFFLNIDD